jgi:DNA-binding CsgD family transcriptional regulator
MPESQRVRLRDLREIDRTVGECLELWADPAGWQTHLLERAVGMLGGRVAVYLEMEPVDGAAPRRVFEARHVGFVDERERRARFDFWFDPRVCDPRPLYAEWDRMLHGGDGFTVLLTDLHTEASWNASGLGRVYGPLPRRNHVLVSVRRPAHTGTLTLIRPSRDNDDRPLAARQRRILHLLHHEIAPLIGTRLTTWRHRSMQGLSPRLRQVLDLLLDGGGEAEIARHLHRSTPTVHAHVMSLYRHFEVNSRGELMAYFVRRRPRVADEVRPSAAVAAAAS